MKKVVEENEDNKPQSGYAGAGSSNPSGQKSNVTRIAIIIAGVALVGLLILMFL